MAHEAPVRGKMAERRGGSDPAVILVSGATSGIGADIASAAVTAGHQVVGLYRSNTEAAAEMANRYASADGSLSLHQVDIRNKESTASVVREVVAQHGHVDALVNCAGINRRAPFLTGDLDDWREIFEINVLGLMIASQVVAGVMVDQGYGRIVNISSIAADYALGDRLAYEASKAAVNRVTKSLAYELGPYGVQVNAVAPGLVRTPMTERMGEVDLKKRLVDIPIGRLGERSEVADLALYVALDAPAYMTGAVIPIDGGRTT